MTTTISRTTRRAQWAALAVAGLAMVAMLPGIASAATYVKVADEWGTILTAGVRPASNGNRFWNIESFDTGFGSSGTLRFYMDGLKAKLDADFPGGWKIDNVTMVTEQSNAAFTAPGGISIYHFTNDALALTNATDSGGGADKAPGNFGSLPASTLIFDNNGTADGQPVRVTDAGNPADMGSVTRVSDYMQTTTGSTNTGNLDVIGTTGQIVDPAGAFNVAPNYGVSFPAINSNDEKLSTFVTEQAGDSGVLLAAGLNAIKADIQSGTDALSFIYAATNATGIAAATYKGNPFTLTGDYNGDSVVDAADYTIWRDTLGSTTDLRANGTNVAPSDGKIDEADYTSWKTNFGMASQGQYPPRIYIQASALAVGSGGLSGIPEPASCVLALLGIAGLAAVRRRVQLEV